MQQKFPYNMSLCRAKQFLSDRKNLVPAQGMMFKYEPSQPHWLTYIIHGKYRVDLYQVIAKNPGLKI